jgi:hypothetical protein
MANFRIFQVPDQRAAQREVDPAFEVLNYSLNDRLDWFEYGPMRRFLLTETLDESCFYGFIPPQFASKSELTAVQMAEFIRQCDGQAEVILFSPRIDGGAQFLNVFEHGDAAHPGLLAASRRLLARIESRIDLDDLVTDSQNTVHSGCLVAKPRFWRQWLKITDQIFGLAESSTDQLGRTLTSSMPCRERGEVQMKVLIMDRIATLLLATDATFAVRVLRPVLTSQQVCRTPVAILSDALKIAYRAQALSQYQNVLRFVRTARKFWRFELRLGSWISLVRMRSDVRKHE